MSDDHKPLDWKEDYAIGHLGLDGEHRYFIELVNRLSLVLAAKASKQEILDLLFLLESETEIHFQHEEEVLMLTGYPTVRDHAEAHRKLMADITAVRKAVEARADRDVALEGQRIGSLRTAMVEHILSEDMALRSHFN